jgi:hypothetical protein
MAARRKPVPVTGRIWTSEDVAERWGITNESVCAMFRDGRVPGAFKAARWWRISEEALVRYERTGGFGTVSYEEQVSA